jgi:WD40 repeat protein
VPSEVAPPVGELLKKWQLITMVAQRGRVGVYRKRATYTTNGAVDTINSPHGEQIRVCDQPLHSVEWSPDFSHFACVQRAAVDVWHTATCTIQCSLGYHSSVPSVTWSPDGDIIATSSVLGSVRLWSSSSGALVRDIPNTQHTTCVAWNPTSATLAAVSLTRTVTVLDTRSGLVLYVLKGHIAVVEAVRWSPDGCKLATGSADGAVKVWDGRSGALTNVLEEKGQVTALAWSPDGARLAVGLHEAEKEELCVSLMLWDGSTGGCTRSPVEHERPVTSIAWSPDKRTLATASLDGSVRLCDCTTGNCLKVLEGHTDAVHSVAWHTLGREVLTASWDGTIRIYCV